MKQSWINRPIFIVSIGKTGTTLLVAMFDGHEELVVIPEETDFFDASYTPIKVLLKNPFLSRKRKIESIVDLITEQTHIRLLNGAKREHTPGNDNLDYSSFNYDLFKQKVRSYLSNNEISIKSAIDAIPFAFQSVSAPEVTPKRWVEKTPYHIINVDVKIPTLTKLYPDAKFIHLYREPKDNYWAYKKKTPEKWTPHKFIYDLKRSVTISKKYSDSENHYVLRYEDLVKNSEVTINSLCEFMDISIKTSLYEPTKNGVNWQGNSMHNQKFTGISTNSIGKHEQCPDKEGLELIDKMLVEECAFLGYPNEGVNASKPEEDNYLKYASNRKSVESKNFAKYYLKKIQETTFR